MVQVTQTISGKMGALTVYGDWWSLVEKSDTVPYSKSYWKLLFFNIILNTNII